MFDEVASKENESNMFKANTLQESESEAQEESQVGTTKWVMPHSDLRSFVTGTYINIICMQHNI